MWPPFEDVPEVEVKTFVGVTVACIGNILISAALNIQKLAHNKIQQHYQADNPPLNTVGGNGFIPDDGYEEPRLSEDSLSPPSSPIADAHSLGYNAQEEYIETNYLKSKSWWFGILLMVTGETGNFIAYGFAPASTIAPLGTVALVSNVILAPMMLHERFRFRDLLGVLLAVAGAVIVVFNSKSEEIKLSPDMIKEYILQTSFLIYTVISLAVGLFLALISDSVGPRLILVDLGLVAIFGGYTVLATKGLASLVSLTLYNMFTFGISYLLVFVLIFTAIMQVKYLNKSLQRFNSTEVIPTQFVLFTIFAIMGSAVLYHDFESVDHTKLMSFGFGCFLEFLGVYFITSNRKKQRIINKPVNISPPDALSVASDSFVSHTRPRTRPRPLPLRLHDTISIPSSPISPRFQLPGTPRTPRFSLSSSYPSALTPLLHENLVDTGENLVAAAVTGVQAALSGLGARQNANLFADVLYSSGYSSGNASQFTGIHNNRRGSVPGVGPISLPHDPSDSANGTSSTLPRRKSKYFSVDMGRNPLLPSSSMDEGLSRTAKTEDGGILMR